MKITNTLIIHPKDETTTFLNDVYSTIPNMTLVQCDVSKKELLELMSSHDRIMMMGHGSPNGLFAVDQFANTGSYIIDQEMIHILTQNKDNVFIWCYASSFLKNKRLQGFATGMFISEVSEALLYNIKTVNQDMIDESNTCFVEVISRCIEKSAAEIHDSLMKSEYSQLAKTNPVAAYNIERLYYN